jgi:hypothetical protein
METFKELNMLYDNNLELIYSFANISINKNNMIYILLTISVIAILKNGRHTAGIKKKHSIYLIESAIFYSGYYFNSYYIPKKEIHFPLHDSAISAVHPILTIIVYIIVLHIVSENLHSEHKRATKSKLTSMYYLTVLTTSLGSIWASSTEGWGGVWIWDPTEVLLLLLIIFYMMMIHSTVKYIAGLMYSTIAVLYLQLLNKLNISDGIHNFYTNDLSSNIYYLSFVVVSIVVTSTLLWLKKRVLKNKLGISVFFIIVSYYALKNYNVLNSIYVLNISFLTLLLFLVYTSLNINIKKKMYVLTGILILSQYIDITTHPGLTIATYILLHILWKQKLRKWPLTNHLTHYACLLLLVLNHLEYKNWNYTDSQTIVNDTIINQIDTYFEMQNLNGSLKSKKCYIGMENIFLEDINNTYNLSQIKNSFYTFFTTFPNIVMVTFQNTTLDNLYVTMLYKQTLINLFNNKALLISYWVVVFLYITIKKDNRW